MRIWLCEYEIAPRHLVNADSAHRFQVLHDEELAKGNMKGLKDHPKVGQVGGRCQEQPQCKSVSKLARVQRLSAGYGGDTEEFCK